jgi:hypothetical protein
MFGVNASGAAGNAIALHLARRCESYLTCGEQGYFPHVNEPLRVEVGWSACNTRKYRQLQVKSSGGLWIFGFWRQRPIQVPSTSISAAIIGPFPSIQKVEHVREHTSGGGSDVVKFGKVIQISPTADILFNQRERRLRFSGFCSHRVFPRLSNGRPMAGWKRRRRNEGRFRDSAALGVFWRKPSLLWTKTHSRVMA